MTVREKLLALLPPVAAAPIDKKGAHFVRMVCDTEIRDKEKWSAYQSRLDSYCNVMRAQFLKYKNEHNLGRIVDGELCIDRETNTITYYFNAKPKNKRRERR